MRTTRIFTEAENAIKAECDDFFDVLVEGEERFAYTYRNTDGICAVKLHNRVVSSRTLYEFVMYMTQKMIRTFHPDKIVIERPQEIYRKVLASQLYFPKGKDYQRVIEPWRYVVEDRIFDEFGYIINQGRLRELPFGWFDTAEKGCGWISAYNLLKMNHREREMQYCANNLEKHALLGGVAGQSSASLMKFLKAEGLRCQMSLPSSALAAELMKIKKNGILLYNHRHGAHYTAFRNMGNGSVQFYNAVYGKKNHVEQPENFLKNNSFLPTSTVIYVTERDYEYNII